MAEDKNSYHMMLGLPEDITSHPPTAFVPMQHGRIQRASGRICSHHGYRIAASRYHICTRPPDFLLHRDEAVGVSCYVAAAAEVCVSAWPVAVPTARARI